MKTLSVISILCSSMLVHGFGVSSLSKCRFGITARFMSTTQVDLEDRYFQLEEMEDADRAITELYLKSDNTVEFGESDGPTFVAATGSWKLQGNEFLMTLIRTYEAGKDEQLKTDMGKFNYTVERLFTGTIKQVGAHIAMEGVVHLIDDVIGDEEVGYFEMLDTTKERLARDEK